MNNGARRDDYRRASRTVRSPWFAMIGIRAAGAMMFGVRDSTGAEGGAVSAASLRRSITVGTMRTQCKTPAPRRV
ncbi:hypothetical protein Rmf_44440 [Roseomonas fluvialis]|uniref:Uncharacterized protein n=1 Tax=Roseomonas fluvialis TaxID=1750527 RepID=A0ABM9SEJ0_9PROT|nr:hypothetical protein Rmf_44440 [Roseomonas fluvialis]